MYLVTICLQNKTDMQVIYRIKFLTGQNSWVRVPKSRVLNNSWCILHKHWVNQRNVMETYHFIRFALLNNMQKSSKRKILKLRIQNYLLKLAFTELALQQQKWKVGDECIGSVSVLLGNKISMYYAKIQSENCLTQKMIINKICCNLLSSLKEKIVI